MYIAHTAVIDPRDKKYPLIGVDISSVDYYKLPEDTREDAAICGRNENDIFMNVQSKILTEYPNAAIIPGKDIPMATIVKSVKKNMTPDTGKYGMENLAMEYMKKLVKENEESNTKHKEYEIKLNAELGNRKTSMETVAKHLSLDRLVLFRLSMLLADKKNTLKECRDSASELFYLPAKTTAKAITMLVASHVLMMAGEDQKVRYNVPPVDAVKKLAFELGYNNLSDMENDIENGSMLKAMKAMKKINLSDNKDIKIPHELDKLHEAIDTKKARKAKDRIIKEANDETDPDKKKEKDKLKEDMDMIDFDPGVDADEAFSDENVEMTKADQLDLAIIINSSEKNLKVMPFVYSNVYCYKVLYYFYLNKYGFTLPFGKTIPNSSWLIIFSYIIDSQNILELRLDLTKYCLKLGGIGLVEKSEFFNMTTDRKLRNLFRPAITRGDDATNFKFAATACLTLIVKLKSKRIKMAELCDLRIALKEKLNAIMEQTNQLLKTNELENDLRYKLKMSTLQKLVNSALKDDKQDKHFISSMLSDRGVVYDSKRPRMKDLNDLLSFEAFKMASEMLSNYHLYKDDNLNGKAWFVFAILKHYDNNAGYFSVIYGLYGKAVFEGTLAVLFGSSETADKVHLYIKKAMTLVDSPHSKEFQEVFTSDIFATKSLVKIWSADASAAVIRDNPQTANMVADGIQKIGNLNIIQAQNFPMMTKKPRKWMIRLLMCFIVILNITKIRLVTIKH